MLKGCQKKVIMVKDPCSRYFDTAYFVVKSDLPKSTKSSDMLTEAHRMIGAYTNELGDKGNRANNAPPPTPNKRGGSAWIVAGAITGLSLIGIAVSALVILV